MLGQQPRAVEIEAQGGLQGRVGQLAAAQGPHQRVGADAVDALPAADDQTGLGAAEDLVAAEGHHVGAGAHAVGHQRLGGQAECRQVDEGAAAEVPRHRQAAPAAEGGQILQGHGGGEPEDAVVAGVGVEEQPRALADRRLVVGEVGAVGGAHLHGDRAAALHHVGQAEGAADLDQLAPGDHDLAAQGEAVEGDQHRGGVVVDHGRRLGAGQLAEQLLDDAVAAAAPAGLQVDLQAAVAGGGLGDAAEGVCGQGGAAEVGVQDDAGGVDHRAEAGGELAVEALADGGHGELDQLRPVRGGAPLQQVFAQPGEGVPHQAGQDAAVAAVLQPGDPGVVEDAVHRRQGGQRCLGGGHGGSRQIPGPGSPAPGARILDAPAGGKPGEGCGRRGPRRTAAGS